MLVTPLLYFLCRSLLYCISSAALLAIAACPSPTGEVRWGLMTIFGVTSLIIFSPLSFSPVGEMMVTPLLSFYAGHSVTVFSMQVTPLLYFLSSRHQPLLPVPPLRGRLGGG